MPFCYLLECTISKTKKEDELRRDTPKKGSTMNVFMKYSYISIVLSSSGNFPDKYRLILTKSKKCTYVLVKHAMGISLTRIHGIEMRDGCFKN